ncbi:FAD-binding oxidoreductase [Sandarakinorhabdus limnophila]|uniref:FAD-binding oxidoreductase n=1 Tax=Sandarakinorhabdus limnophila TaxID=210512 RepID=UPI0026E92461|nr:FAD-binding oxidoreductase [Sandarakinorhabdus limnophila]
MTELVIPPPPSADALAALKAAAGRHWSEDPDLIGPRLVDWRGRYTGATPLLLLPRDVTTLQAIVRAAAAHRVALVPQGGNTGLVGGGIPPADGSAVLVSCTRMNRIRQVDGAGQLLVAEAGVILADVHAAAADQGMAFPLSLGAKGSATVGGLASTNAGGVQVLRHGTMRALVAGLEAVLPDGSVLNQLQGLAKDNTGLDIKQLLIGAEGTLGFITAVALKLVPAPRHRAVAWAGVDRPQRALALLSRLRQLTGGQVESFELIPADGIDLVATHLGLASPLAGRHAWACLVELAGPQPLDDVLAQGLADADDAVIAQSETQAAALWRRREELPLAERMDGPAVHHDIAVPVSAMADFAEMASAAIEAAFPGGRVLAFGHLGDGNLHFNVRAPAGDAAGAWIADHRTAITARVHEMVATAGGSISAEHGIGVMKRDDLARLGDPARLAAMRAVKQALDPLGIMNPGKIY